jgi:hypothetical protein
MPPASTRQAIGQLPDGWRYQAALGVGVVRAVSGDANGAAGLRSWAERAGGCLNLVNGPDQLYHDIDPWGTPPPGLGLQRRIIERFDPVRVVNRGRLPGGL